LGDNGRKPLAEAGAFEAKETQLFTEFRDTKRQFVAAPEFQQ
jgi:hypothetical protein